ncbi:ly6/PLAUR domain-containing protein 1-like isoform X2 [Scleropages formosus]|uniref:ly6/PLAUR domain-containing protein 1-like isoform X2 n=1 Tax=Scleropages formosus TaxID=113540 RepID=UPI0010FA8139|nr:ly6/PLAUR domain-containing protein 1-like isoform X2 [Scleropages formosus]
MQLLTCTTFLGFLLGTVDTINMFHRSLNVESRENICHGGEHRAGGSRHCHGIALQIQCYQCEEVKHNDCSSPEFIVNCTVNVQDMCQKEVLVKEDGIHYRKSCASSGACLIASSGYQQFCTGKLHSVCISCCNTPLCNGPRQKKRPVPSTAPAARPCVSFRLFERLLFLLLLLLLT